MLKNIQIKKYIFLEKQQCCFIHHFNYDFAAIEPESLFPLHQTRTQHSLFLKRRRSSSTKTISISRKGYKRSDSPALLLSRLNQAETGSIGQYSQSDFIKNCQPKYCEPAHAWTSHDWSVSFWWVEQKQAASWVVWISFYACSGTAGSF